MALLNTINDDPMYLEQPLTYPDCSEPNSDSISWDSYMQNLDPNQLQFFMDNSSMPLFDQDGFSVSASSTASPVTPIEDYTQNTDRLSQLGLFDSPPIEPLELSMDTSLASKAQKPAKQQTTSPTASTRISHTMVERKYRTSLNNLFRDLQQVIPNLPSQRMTKSAIMTGAIEYIKRLEEERDSLRSEVQSSGRRTKRKS